MQTRQGTTETHRTVALNRGLGTEGAKRLGGEKAAFSANGPAATGHPEAENEPSRKMHTVNKRITVLNVKGKTIKYLGEKV